MRCARLLSGVTALALGALGVVLAGSATTASAATAFPAHFSAPYVDAGLSNTTLTSVASATGNKFFTLAFVDGAGCQWSMYNTASWQSQISALRSAGGDVIVSFGGWTTDNGGTDLGNTCSSASAAAAQIENVVTTFGVTHLDFDIESNALTNTTDVTRTNQALAQVRSWGSSTGRSLSISYTIPSFPSGLSSDGTNLLSNGRANGFTPDVVNIMSMDYGTSGTEMGNASNSALDGAASQVASAYGISLSAAYARMGNTPMIGQNDSAGEVFTLADASTVESHAASMGIAMVSFWSEGRDNGGCPGLSTASSTCSGISQNANAFTSAFQRFTGGSSGGGTASEYVSSASSRCLDDPGANTAPGTLQEIWDCHHGANQEWTYTSSKQLQTLGLCLDAVGQGTGAGTKIDLWPCNGQSNQQWNVNSNGTITGVQSGLCLDVIGGGSSPNGTGIDLWPCNSQSNQQWATA
ncbi:hypothetical protein ABIA33_000705 [Streptacidiphilus sp. MAP12-16]|uniref:ricin-type beta-trefoil lectin domain protein n=1 Tax=Streptacidiphilus sp. MAP12-16 TaxID=3156300 RepID=UPI0035168C36